MAPYTCLAPPYLGPLTPRTMSKQYTRIVRTSCLFSLSFSLFMLTSPAQAQVGECVTAASEGCLPATSFGTLQTTTSSDFVAAVANTNAGRYNTFMVTAGQVYEWSLCPDDGATVPVDSDTQLTLRDGQNEHLCNSDDVCEFQAKILWTATYSGEARVQINEYDCEANTANHSMVWRCTSCGAIGIEEPASSMVIATWPSPAADRLQLTFGNASTGRVDYVVNDALGRQVLNGMVMNTGGNVLDLDISGLAAGQYILRGTMGSVYGSQSFTKQ